MIFNFIYWNFGFLRMGTVGIVAQAYGRSDYREIVKTILRNIAIALIAAFIIIIFFFTLSFGRIPIIHLNLRLVILTFI